MEIISRHLFVAAVLIGSQAPQSVENKKYKNTLFILLLVSLFIECDFWVDPGDFERKKKTGSTQKSHSMNKDTQGAR